VPVISNHDTGTKLKYDYNMPIIGSFTFALTQFENQVYDFFTIMSCLWIKYNKLVFKIFALREL